MTQLTSDRTLRYNAKDAVATIRAAEGFMHEVWNGPYKETYYHTLSILDPLMYMMIRGVRVNMGELEKMKRKCDGLINQYQIKLNELCGRTLNANSPTDCKKYFYIEKGIPPYTKRGSKGSTVTCDDKALQRLARGTTARKGFEEARIIQRIRQLQKLKGTYLDIVFDEDQRMRCSYNPRGTRFGRLSSSKTIFETGMNMQNLPPAFMQFLEADEDRIIISFDKAKAEWVVMAYISGDAAMIHAVESGVDVHAFTASTMFKVPIEIVKLEDKAVGKETDPDTITSIRTAMQEMKPYLERWLPRTMSMRQCGKKSNHGLNYDEQAGMFGLINEISVKEADAIINFYHGGYPGIKRYYGTVQGKLTEDRTLYNLFGRPYNFRDKWGDDLFKSAYSFVPQSTVGELVNRAMERIYNDDSQSTENLELLMQVHDSLDFQTTYSDLDQLVKCIRTIQGYMSIELEAGGRRFTIGTDLKAGFTFGALKELNLALPDEQLKASLKTLIDEKAA